MRFDIFDDTLPSLAIPVTEVTADGTTTGETIQVKVDDEEIKGQALLFLLGTGTLTDGTYTPVIQDSEDGMVWNDVEDKFLKGTEAGAALDASDKISKIGYLGNKPYVRINVLASSVTTGGDIYAQAIFQHRHLTDFTTQVY